MDLVQRDGASIPGFAPGDCDPISGDSIDIPVRWQKGMPIGAGAQAEIRLQFELRRARLYSFWIA